MYQKASTLLLSIASGVGAVLLLFLFVPAQSANTNLLQVHFLDVGQGDAIFIEAPNGKQMLIDGGRTDNKVLAELAAVMPMSDRSIDVVLATHPDADHVGGLAEVLQRYKIDVFFASQEGDTMVAKSLLNAYQNSDAQGLYARHGMRLVLDADRSVFADVLFPDRDVHGWETNAGSVVVRLSYGEKSFLLTGDAPVSVEDFLTKAESALVNADVLKLGHHGSKTSSGGTFLKAVTPELAIVSVGKNSYGHPHPEVLSRLKQLSIPWLSTQNEGTITLVTDGKILARE